MPLTELSIQEFNFLLELHSRFLAGHPDGKKVNFTDTKFWFTHVRDMDLSGISFRRAHLRGCSFQNCDMRRTDFAGAQLISVDIKYSDCREAIFDAATTACCDFNVSNFTKASFREVLWDSETDLSAVILREATGLPEAPLVKDLDQKLVEALHVDGNRLDMGSWHMCKTVHCRGGWTTTLAGAAGKKLDRRYGTCMAAALIYAKAYPNRPVPDFYANGEHAWKDIEACAKLTADASSAAL